MGNLVQKSINESSGKPGEHEVKVRFAREFADVGSSHSAPESLSSASSFHSLSSTLSTKSSSGICPDSAPSSPNESANLSYVNGNIPGVEDLITACAEIQLNTEESFTGGFETSRDISQDQTFASATDEPPNDLIDDLQLPLDPENEDVERPILGTTREPCVSLEDILPEEGAETLALSTTVSLRELLECPTLPSLTLSDTSSQNSASIEQLLARSSSPVSNSESAREELSNVEESVVDSVKVSSNLEVIAERSEEIVLADSIKTVEDQAGDSIHVIAEGSVEDYNVIEEGPVEDYNVIAEGSAEDYNVIEEGSKTVEDDNVIEEGSETPEDVIERAEGSKTALEESELDRTLTIQSHLLENVTELEQYTDFQPPRQSTTLTLPESRGLEFEELKSDDVANDIFKTALDIQEESDNFVSATSELFQDPTSFDFLLARSTSRTINRLRAESLYVKFDPLVGDVSMLPQSNNSQTINEEQNGKNESPLPSVGTPKRSPAIAAIDRLLFYSPSGTIQKTEETKEKISTEEEKDAADVNMSKELELVRATVLQLEEELGKQKKEYEAELEQQKNGFQEKINKLQAQMAQEVNSKSQMTVVVEEYEKSISRLHTQREKDRTIFEQERAKLQEELQAAQEHLTNTEAAFNDVHQKYERLKGVVSAYKSNETVLKESIQENMETIRGLEMRYEQLKEHAMAQLEKANFELDAMRKQHEDETVKLHALVRKAELKSNSLAELVEQKTKENKELTQILDEVIARVGHQNAE